MSPLVELLTSPLPHAIGWALAHFVWQGTLAAGILWLLLRLHVARTSAGRYVLCGVTLAACIISVVCTFVFAFGEGTAGPVSNPTAAAVAPVAVPVAGTSAAPADAPVEPAPSPAWRRVAASWLEPLLPWLVVMWACGVALLSLRLLGAWAFTQHLKHRLLQPVPTWLKEMFDALRERLQVFTYVRIFESAAVESPVAIGWLRPVVLLPARAITGLSEVQLETILAHELAHIRRHDYLVNLLQSIAETALFFHPAVWWISSRIREEREHCCDDIAVSACGHELEYAEALATLASQRHETAQFAMAATGGSLLGRVQRILAGSGPAVPVSRPAAALAGVVMFSLLITVVAQAYVINQQRVAYGAKAEFTDVSKGWPERYRRTVTMQWQNAPLSAIAASMTTQTGLVIPLPADAVNEPMTVRFDGAPLHLALDAILNRARIGWRLVGNEQIITEPWQGRGYWLARWRTDAAGHETEKEYYLPGYNPIVYAAKDARLESALKIIGAQMGSRITAPASELSRTVTCNFHHDLARDCLANLLAPLQLDYRVINDAEIEVFAMKPAPK